MPEQNVERWQEDLKDISIRGRQSLGALCLKRFCIAKDIAHPEIDHFFGHCFDLAIAVDLVQWEQDASPLTSVGLGYDDLDLDEIVPTRYLKAFSLLLYAVTEIGYCDLYGATSDRSLKSLIDTFQILKGENIPLPDLDLFKISPFQALGGWGDPVSPETDLVWRTTL